MDTALNASTEETTMSKAQITKALQGHQQRGQAARAERIVVAGYPYSHNPYLPHAPVADCFPGCVPPMDSATRPNTEETTMTTMTTMTPTEHEKREWSRCAVAQYAAGRNDAGHLLSGCAATPRNGALSLERFDRAMATYRAWLVFGTQAERSA